MGYLNEAINGIRWMSLYRILYRSIGLSRIVILARLLTPSDFGIFGIATIVLGFLEILTETGVNVFLIQQKENFEDYVDTAWVVSIGRGILISLLIAFLAFPIASFFNSPDSISILLLIALVPLLRGFINPSVISFQKDLNFKKEFSYRILVFLIEAGSSILLAFLTKSAFSLAWGLVIGAVFEVIYTFIIARPLPKLIFDKERIVKIISKGKWVTGFGIFDYIYTQSDNVIVGKFLGQAALGIYDNAYTISTSPITEVGDVFYRVMFPLFSKISNDKKILINAFIKNTLVNILLIIPSGLIIYFFADPIVRILLGSAWTLAIPIVKILAVLGIIRGIANSTHSFLVSQERQKYSAIITFVSAFGLWIFLIPLVQKYGSSGAAYASILGTLISIPFTIYFVHKAIKSA